MTLPVIAAEVEHALVRGFRPPHRQRPQGDGDRAHLGYTAKQRLGQHGSPVGGGVLDPVRLTGTGQVRLGPLPRGGARNPPRVGRRRRVPLLAREGHGLPGLVHALQRLLVDAVGDGRPAAHCPESMTGS